MGPARTVAHYIEPMTIRAKPNVAVKQTRIKIG
jgi:hypothetical protein